MLHITFLEHSGFLVETDRQYLLFDWWKGELPPITADKPLYVFASHQHHDHFQPGIFALPAVRYFLGCDIRLDRHNREKWKLSPETAECCLCLKGNERRELPDLLVETLPSTDEGVAFLVTSGGVTLYHAGDLNWWHWEEEGKDWNGTMAANFRRYLEPLRQRHIHVAFAPLDPRQGGAYDWGLTYLLGLARIDTVFPMHQWDDFALTRRFLQEHPELAPQIQPVDFPGQQWTLPL